MATSEASAPPRVKTPEAMESQDVEKIQDGPLRFEAVMLPSLSKKVVCCSRALAGTHGKAASESCAPLARNSFHPMVGFDVWCREHHRGAEDSGLAPSVTSALSSREMGRKKHDKKQRKQTAYLGFVKRR